MTRVSLIAGNWKMNKTVGEAVELARQIRDSLSGAVGVEVAIAPAFTALYAVQRELEGSAVRLAAQNLFWEEKGAYTGEISPAMLKDLGCCYVIIGHSERRQFFGDTDDTVNKKMKAALNHELTPIFCVGETLREREEGKAFEVIGRQVEKGLQGITERETEKVVIAYEPVWAIGTGKTATPEQAQEVHQFIRRRLEVLYTAGAAGRIRIQYGGSVSPENVKGLMSQPDIDGALVGGASLKAEAFSKIVRFEEM